ncbi:two-component sensor histidine kinase [Marinomonas mediterranea]|uniref:ATP-binding protein n=1 Tax=Marinomonas mediterranea TaxID=119864 RepID=UPI00234AB3AB|nr:ATP-binding protein [Marinomonas mediterranea]WCN14219.1 two-component sensor histidine kinase [Marinomonas mediterranea]
MRAEVWRLYRHLLIGGGVIIACCYAAIEFTQHQFSVSEYEQHLCADAEINAAALLLIPGYDPSGSHLSWRFGSEASGVLDAQKVVNLLSNENWLYLSDHNFKLSLVDDNKTLLTGESISEHGFAGHLFSSQNSFEALLNSFLKFDDKLAILESFQCISAKLIDRIDFVPEGRLLGSHGLGFDTSYIWSPKDSDKSVLIGIAKSQMVSFTVVVVSVVAMAIVVMLLLIWRELVTLEVKRKTFESITRQIARGRSGLPKGIPDSSGTLKELAYSFDSMSSHIQRLLKVQREMINAISHELRTPIARLRFGLEVVKDEIDESAHNTISALEDDVEELNTLVDEVLTYGKLEEGSLALNFEETSIRQLIDGILEHNQPLLKHLNVSVFIDDDDEVIADAHHLHRALQNLILNASKYANVAISIRFSADDSRWQVDIEDDGPGIAFEDRDKVFIPFQRLDNSRTRASGGYGLGLAIVQRIAFWHGGAVLVDSSGLGGAKFSLIWSKNQHSESVS